MRTALVTMFWMAVSTLSWFAMWLIAMGVLVAVAEAGAISGDTMESVAEPSAALMVVGLVVVPTVVLMLGMRAKLPGTRNRVTAVGFPVQGRKTDPASAQGLNSGPA